MTPNDRGSAAGVATAPYPESIPRSNSDAADPEWSEAFWPTECQRLLLQTALLPRPGALAAWREWRSRYDFFDHPHGDGAFKLYPLVYKRLVAEDVDEPLLPRMKGIYRYWWSSNQRLFAMAAKLLEELHRAGVNTLVLKGAAVSPLYYKDIGARPMSDVDVLVTLDQVERALGCLQQAGWRAVTPSVLNDVRLAVRDWAAMRRETMKFAAEFDGLMTSEAQDDPCATRPARSSIFTGTRSGSACDRTPTTTSGAAPGPSRSEASARWRPMPPTRCCIRSFTAFAGTPSLRFAGSPTARRFS